MRTGLTPGLLIASPLLTDPNFTRTVVLMCLHNDESALGLVLNRSSGLSVRQVFEDLELAPADDMWARDVLIGGPVQPHQGWVLYASMEPAGEEEIAVGPGLRLSASKSILERIGRGEGPSRYQLLFGYAGWGPQQLESEIGEGSWLPAELDETLIFETQIDERWGHALASLGIDPAVASLGALGFGSTGDA